MEITTKMSQQPSTEGQGQGQGVKRLTSKKRRTPSITPINQKFFLISSGILSRQPCKINIIIKIDTQLLLS